MGPREIKESGGKRMEERVARISGDNMRLTLYNGRSVIFHEESVQFSQQTGNHKVSQQE